jgi:hypothetical protein
MDRNDTRLQTQSSVGKSLSNPGDDKGAGNGEKNDFRVILEV